MSHAAVNDVVARLVGVMETLGVDMAKALAEVVDHVLPLNYAPWAIQRLRDQLAEEPCGLLENEVSTRSLAEIIMAGYDQQPARFVSLTDGSGEVCGKTALDYPEGPEEGHDILSTAHSLLSDLVARQDTLLGAPHRPLVRTSESPRSEAELLRKIATNAKRLGGTLTGVSNMASDRTVYCVLPALQKAPEREFRRQVLRVVRGHLQPHVQQFIFVELLESPTDAREFDDSMALAYACRVTQRLPDTIAHDPGVLRAVHEVYDLVRPYVDETHVPPRYDPAQRPSVN